MDSVPQLLQRAQESFNNKKYDEAIEDLNRVLRIDGANHEALYFLGVIQFTIGNAPKAAGHFQRAVEIKGDDPKYVFNYASTLFETGRYSDALKQFRRVLDLKPDHIPALNKCCVIVGMMGNSTLAERIAKSIIEKDTAFVEAYNNLGNAYKDQGRIQEAVASYRKALALKPDFATAASNLLLCLNYSSLDPQTVFEEHKQWEKRLAPLTASKPRLSSGALHGKKQIHVGYVSPDFRIHSVGYFLEPVIAHHDTTRFKIFCYADVACSDKTTEQIKNRASVWRSIYAIEDRHVIDMIKADGIDILVDLAGHSGNNRLPLFLHKPAPVQVTYLGYPNTTGISAMDYRLTDALADPQGADRYHTEKLYRLPGCFLCYKPPENAPAISEAPVLKNGYVTFGSFNNLPKINNEIIGVWAEILDKTPGSKLIIKTKPFNDRTVMQQYENLFMQRGIDPQRLQCVGHSPSKEEHLGWYNSIDIALDTFPYNGTTTTCEALFMGVPVVTLAGSVHAGRVGASILSRVGLPELTGFGKKEYVAIASNLGSDSAFLSETRKSLRKQVLHAPLCDAASFTVALENAYKDMIEIFRN